MNYSGYVLVIKRVKQLLIFVPIDVGEEGDIQGDNFGDRKVFIHKMKDGDVLNWAGQLLSRETYTIIDEISVDIPY